MKTVLLLVASLVVLGAAQLDQRRIKEIEALLANKNYRDTIFKCLLDDTAPCDSNGEKIKKNLRRGFSLGECPSDICTPEEASMAPKIHDSIQKENPVEYKKITDKYGQPKAAPKPA